MSHLLILGMGGHAKVILECACLLKRYEKISFLDDKKKGESLYGYEAIGTLDDITKFKGQYEEAIVAIGDNALRIKLTETLLKIGYKVPIIIHPSAIVSEYSVIESGTVILPSVVINAGTQLGRAVIVNSGAIVEHDCVLEDGVHISPGARLGGGVKVGAMSWIGMGATVIQGLYIGKACIVGAGAVVVRNVEDNSTVYGVPAKPKASKSATRILILANHDIGLYKFRKELIETLLQQGKEVYIVLPKGRNIPKLIALGCHFIPLEMDRRSINPFKDITILMNYYRIVTHIKPHLILTYTIKPNIYGGIIGRLKHIPYITNITGLGSGFMQHTLLRKIVIRLYKLSLKKASYVFFENVSNAVLFTKEKIIKETQKVVMHGAGVNLEEYTKVPLPEDQKNIRFLFIGRIMKEKGVDELFNVAKRMKENHRPAIFDIVGPYEENYKKRIDELTEKHIINYYGYKEDVKPLIVAAHCFILPSYHEGMANTLLEAGAMGRPLITSDIPGCKEAVLENGFLIMPRDEEDLYNKIEQFIRLSKEEKEAMANHSRAYIEGHFDRKQVVEETLEYIQQVETSNLSKKKEQSEGGLKKWHRLESYKFSQY